MSGALSFRAAAVSLLLASLPLFACSSDDSDHGSQPHASRAYYRFWQGWKRADISEDAFQQSLNRDFIPTGPRALGDKGLSAYHVVIPPADQPAFVPDEIALLAYPSQSIYEAARSSPEGTAFGDLHWTLFERSTSKSAVPRSFAHENPTRLTPGEAYDLRDGNVDWQKGHSVFYLGTRKANVTQEDFMIRLASHVRVVREAFTSVQLGYVVLAMPEYEIAFTNWTSESAMNEAFQSEKGKAAMADADAIMTGVMWTAEVDFAGNAVPGKHVNVRFEPR